MLKARSHSILISLVLKFISITKILKRAVSFVKHEYSLFGMKSVSAHSLSCMRQHAYIFKWARHIGNRISWKHVIPTGDILKILCTRSRSSMNANGEHKGRWLAVDTENDLG